jgi:hypothetical protein
MLAHRNVIQKGVTMTIPHRREWWVLITAFSLVAGLFTATVAATAAQAFPVAEGAPVDIHSGSCGNMLAEPAYDGGDVAYTTLNEIGDDEFYQNIDEDEEAGAIGVDLDQDDALEENEIIGAAGGDAPIAIAESDLGEDIDEAQPYVVALHAGPDQYQTILACGSITDAQVDDTGRRIVYLQPVGNANVFGYSVLEDDGQSITTYLFQPGTAPQPTAATTPEVPGFPIDIHRGTCSDWTTEPAFDVGTMIETNVAAPGEQAAGELEGDVPANAATLGAVYKVDAETQFDAEELLNEGPYVVGVHESAQNYANLVACGEILPVIEDDTVLVLLKPVGTSMQTGQVQIRQDSGELSGLLWSCEPIQPQPPEPTPTPPPTPTPTPEPTPTPTQPATAVVVETVVIRETEVVPAPTATAAAQQAGDSAVVELGDEPAGTLTSQAGQTLTLNNPSDADRVFRVEDLGIEETIPAGQQVEVTLPADAQPGTYAYQVLEGEETVFEGDFTVE